jgi:hypothetical protein
MPMGSLESRLPNERLEQTDPPQPDVQVLAGHIVVFVHLMRAADEKLPVAEFARIQTDHKTEFLRIQLQLLAG